MQDQFNPLSQFLCNPDVVLREEDEEGALLYNPDTNQVKILNITGLAIWKALTSPNTIEGVALNLLKDFEGAPEEEVRSDVQEFVAMMVADGFIGILNGQGDQLRFIDCKHS
jgi:hypothetical protein